MMCFCLSYHKVQKSARTDPEFNSGWITPRTARGKTTHPAAQELRSSSTPSELCVEWFSLPRVAQGLRGVIHICLLRKLFMKFKQPLNHFKTKKI